MSASTKKKLRSETDGLKMTERQTAEQKEAKKVQLYTYLFVAVMAVMIVFAIVAGVSNYNAKNGTSEKNTIAATITTPTGSHNISNAELNYYFIEQVNNFSSNYGSYAYLFGLDTSKTLDQQVYNEETGATWADNFIDSAISNAQAVYTLCDAAKAEGYSLSPDEEAEISSYGTTIDTYAKLYGYSDADAFLKAQYGKGATKATYLEYVRMSTLASSYQTAHQDSIVISDEAISARDAENPAAYSSFSYNQYYLAANKFLTGGTTDENGTVTYSDEENAASREACKEAAEALTVCTTAEELDAAIAAMSINEGNESAKSTAYTNQAYTSVSSYVQEWVTDASRKVGDMTAIPYTTTDAEGNEIATAYYVVLFNGSSDNTVNLVNVRHILVSFEGEQDESGNYTDEAKAACLAKAEDILAQYKADPTEEKFAELANANSTDTGSNTNGGLYTDVYPGQMVSTFNDWCFDADRAVGDTGIVETTYGYHVMFFSAKSDETYRTYQIRNELTTENFNDWYNGLIEAASSAKLDTSKLNTSVKVSAS